MSNLGPNLSTSQPCTGEQNVCSTISSENVTWSEAGAAPSACPSGLVNNVQTYCGLAIAIMQITPSNNWTHREPTAVTGMSDATT
jgi:hypothetical protein